MTSDPKILTDRFRKIYFELIENGQLIPDSSGDKSLRAFAKKIGLDDETAIQLWVAGSANIPDHLAFKFCTVFDIPTERMFEDITNIFDLVSKKAGNIIWIEDIEFFCGNGEIYNPSKNFVRYDDFSVNGEYWAFRASGNSMEKTIFSGDTVYATKLEKPDFLNKNEVCALVFFNKIYDCDEAIMKRVNNKVYDKKTGKLTHVILTSDNMDLYPKNIKIEVAKIRHAFKIVEIKSKNTSRRL